MIDPKTRAHAERLAAEATDRARAKRAAAISASARPVQPEPERKVPPALDADELAAMEASGLADSRRADLQRSRQAAPVDPAEAEAARSRRDALKAVRKDLARRADTADMDPWQALARGLVRDGKHLRALAPTRQIGDMAVPSRRRAAILERGELAALAHYHGLWMETRVGMAAVDPERIRVDGGGGGDIGWRYGRAVESERERKRLRAGLGNANQAAVLDWVVILDQPLENFCMKAIYPITQRDLVIGARYALFLEAARGLRRQLAY